MDLARQRLGVLALAAAIAGASGCSYTSTYQPPRDGRARLLWTGTDVAADLGGAQPGSSCLDLVGWPERGEPPLPPGSRGPWAPRYWGPPLVLLVPGLPPPFLRPPIFLPPHLLLLGRAAAAGAFVAPPRGGSPSGVVGRLGGKVDERVIVVLAAAAIVAIAVANFALALDVPESRQSPAAIDRVNAYNDWARTPGSPCWPETWSLPPVDADGAGAQP